LHRIEPSIDFEEGMEGEEERRRREEREERFQVSMHQQLQNAIMQFAAINKALPREHSG
jgi:hypothetical protein